MYSRFAYLCLACGCIGLGAAGVLLPLLPTTPFLLVAAWAAPKASPRLANWLHEHPRFGPLLKAWWEERAIPSRAKLAACLLMSTSWLMLLITATSPVVPVVTGLLFVAVGIYVCTRPLPQVDRSPP